MPISTNTDSLTGYLCKGGFSFGRRKVLSYDPPKDSKDIGPHETFFEGHDTRRYCRRCHTYMGCKFCAQRDSELVCLRCHDWALPEGEAEHGKMLNRDLILAKVKSLTNHLEAQMFVPQNRRGSEFDLDWEDQERRQVLREQAKKLGVAS